MVDFEFYVNTYLGSAIPETAFLGAAEQAGRALRRFKRMYQVTADPEGEKLALCAMAEAVYAASCQKKRVASASVGQMSVHYVQEEKRSLERTLYEQALLYLDIYRGVGA